MCEVIPCGEGRLVPSGFSRVADAPTSQEDANVEVVFHDARSAGVPA
jgi:hypothetical protein